VQQVSRAERLADDGEQRGPCVVRRPDRGPPCRCGVHGCWRRHPRHASRGRDGRAGVSGGVQGCSRQRSGVRVAHRLPGRSLVPRLRGGCDGSSERRSAHGGCLQRAGRARSPVRPGGSTERHGDPQGVLWRSARGLRRRGVVPERDLRGPSGIGNRVPRRPRVRRGHPMSGGYLRGQAPIGQRRCVQAHDGLCRGIAGAVLPDPTRSQLRHVSSVEAHGRTVRDGPVCWRVQGWALRVVVRIALRMLAAPRELR